MRSMTGYGRAACALAGGTLTVQVSSVNRRSLDLTVKLPAEWESLEAEIADRVRRVAARGKVDVEVEYAPAGGRDEASWNEAAVGAALDKLAALADARRIPFEPTAELLWQVANSLRTPSEAPSGDRVRPELYAVLDEALRSFAAMRAREGEALFVDFIERIGICRRQMDAVAARAPAVAPAYRAQLLKRLRDAGLELNIDDERVLREIALFADRCDVSEEITRFAATPTSCPRSSSPTARSGARPTSSSRRWAARPTRSAARRTTWRSRRA